MDAESLWFSVQAAEAEKWQIRLERKTRQAGARTYERFLVSLFTSSFGNIEHIYEIPLTKVIYPQGKNKMKYATVLPEVEKRATINCDNQCF